jgi:Protein of unknown function (DUF3795)
MNGRRNEVGPCGVFCAACPSFNKTCIGCPSENKEQKRTSKWNCKIRQCCYEIKKLDYCAYCEDFPCSIIKKKLIKSHIGDDRFKYRHEISDNNEKIKLSGIDEFIKIKKKDYLCDQCGGTICFYHYKCDQCGMVFLK